MQLDKWTHKNEERQLINGYFRRNSHSGSSHLLATKETVQRIHFLHGTGFSSLCNARLAEYLPNNWDLWFTDVPGHGESTQPDINKMPNWLNMADTFSKAAFEMTDIENKGKIIGVGHSLGGVLTLLAASRHPDYFSRIILFDPVLFISPIIAFQHCARLTGLWKYGRTARAVNKRRRLWPDQETMRFECLESD